jgi:hypothetical protein
MKSLSHSPQFQPKAAPMMTSASLLAAGAVLGLCGMIVGGSAMFSATRNWWQHLAAEAALAGPAWGRPMRSAMGVGARQMDGHRTPARSGRA